MLITFLRNCRLTEDGFAMKSFLKGEKREVADTAARYALNKGWAYNSEPFDDELSAPAVIIPLPNKNMSAFGLRNAMREEGDAA